MIAPVLDRHIEITPGVCGGKPRIAGHRITVQNIAVWHERMGMSPDEIATEYDLTLGDVYAALTYFHDHRAEIQDRAKKDEAFAAELRRRMPSVLTVKLDSLRGAAGRSRTSGPSEK